MRTTERRVKTNASGHWELAAGGHLDPERIDDSTDMSATQFVFETVAVDVNRIVRAKLTIYARGLDYDAPRTDRSDTRWVRSTQPADDLRGLLMATVALEGERRTV